ncbi:MAG: hypothetical protein WC852_00335 [Candidatus Nanoarchaeia archaeon]|jgi:hypothetical protein
MHHKAKSTIILLLATIFIVAGYAVLYFSDTKEIPCPQLGGTCKSMCAIGEKQAGSCGEMKCCISATSSNEISFFTDAVKNRDISLCSKLVLDLQSSCKILVMDALSNDLALKYNDISQCYDIIDLGIKDNCMREIAWKLNNIGNCLNISSKNIKDKCVMFFALKQKDWQLCANSIEIDINRDICFKQLAIASKSLGICNEISMESELADCTLKVELAVHSENNIDCSIVPKAECAITRGCKPVLVTDQLESLKDAYGGCSRDSKYFCESTGGNWLVTEQGLEVSETCDCGSKAYYEGYGCFDCNEFEFAKSDCIRRLNRNVQG